MATSSFKSTSRRPTSSTADTPKSQPLKQPKKLQNSTQKAPPRRSRSVSAFPRTHFDVTNEFQNKRENPLFWVDGSSNFEEDFHGGIVINNGVSKFVDMGGDSNGSGEINRRGRSVSRNSGGERKFSGGGSGGGGSGGGEGKKGCGRSLSRVNSGHRRRSMSRGRYGTSESERELETGSSKHRINISSDGKSTLLERNGKLVRSASDLSEVMKGYNTWSSQHPVFENSDDSSLRRSAPRISHWDDGISTSLFSEAEEKTIKPVSVEKITPSKDINGTRSVILETVRSEVRQAISDMQYDLKNAMLRGSPDVIQSSIISDGAPELEISCTVGLVRDIREEFSRELEECEERTRKLREELAVEEHREIELNKILHDVVPEPETPLMQKPRAVRKASFERKRMSKRLEEEALAFFDECVSISTFEDSEFSSPEDFPFNMFSVDGPDSEKVGLPEVPGRVSVACSFESQDDMQRTAVVPHHDVSNPSVASSLKEDIRNYIKVFSKDNGRERSNAQVSSTSLQSSRDYSCELPKEKRLLDRLTFRSRIESGRMLLCETGLSLSASPMSSGLW